MKRPPGQPLNGPAARARLFTPLVSSSRLGSGAVFRPLVRLRRLRFGGPALEELKRGDLSGVTELEELTVDANNLTR